MATENLRQLYKIINLLDLRRLKELRILIAKRISLLKSRASKKREFETYKQEVAEQEKIEIEKIYKKLTAKRSS